MSPAQKPMEPEALPDATIVLLHDMQRLGKTLREISSELRIDYATVEYELYWKAVQK